MIHSVPARVPEACCFNTGRPAHPRLRGAVLGYGGFRSGDGRAVRHHLLPLGFVTVIVDFVSGDGLVTGARGRLTGDGDSSWGHGVTVGLSPAGVSELLGVPMRDLTGQIIPLSDVVGTRAGELVERLASASGWDGRFAALDEMLAGWAAAAGAGDPGVSEAWRRLHRSGGRCRVGDLAGGLGIGRRQLERGFREQLGISPGTVGRIARFQRAVDLISRVRRWLRQPPAAVLPTNRICPARPAPWPA